MAKMGRPKRVKNPVEKLPSVMLWVFDNMHLPPERFAEKCATKHPRGAPALMAWVKENPTNKMKFMNKVMEAFMTKDENVANEESEPCTVLIDKMLEGYKKERLAREQNQANPKGPKPKRQANGTVISGSNEGRGESSPSSVPDPTGDGTSPDPSQGS
jgi:hypothetical protein